MKIICQSCQSKYNVADEKVQGKTVKIRCRKCGATIVVSGNGVAGEPAALSPATGAAAAGMDGEGQYHVNVSDGDQRTMTIAEIVQAYNEGTITQETYLWTDGMDDWLPLAQVDAIVAALNAAASPPAEHPMGGPEAATVETHAAAVSAVAAAPMVAAQPEAKRAAVVRREGRANRDLFGSGGELATAQDVQTSAPMFATGAAMDAGGGATGQRNENSVLFSLAALTSMAAQPQASGGGGATKDDSGLIDLKAMTAAAAASPMKRVSEAPAAPLFPVASPFGMDQPILAAPSNAPPAKNRLPLFIGLGAGAFAVLATIGIIIIVKLSATKPVEVIEVPAAVSTSPVASAAPSDDSSATSSASPPATASPSASVAKNTASATRPKNGATGRPGGAPAAPGAAPAAAPTKPPAVHTGSCGCSGDDLMCQIKCAAGKH